MSKASRRPRQTEAQWQQIISDFQQSDLTAALFCQQHDLAYGTFARWRQYFSRIEQSSSATPELIELVAPVMPSSTAQWDVELELGHGMLLRLRTR